MLSSGNFQRNFGQFKRDNEVLILQSLASPSIIFFFIPLHVLAGFYRISALTSPEVTLAQIIEEV